MKSIEELTGLYSLSKTLRFELKPIGKTLEQIERKGLLTQDEQRSEEYERMKIIIDDYHKRFIAMCLRNCKLKVENIDNQNDSLEEYASLLSKSKRDDSDEIVLEKIKENLRKQIVKAFKNGNTYGDLFKKELVKKHLPDFVTDAEDKQIVQNFNNFTTYFTGFHENRKNMYSDEAKSTAIAYRLIHENFPRFYDNLRSFAIIAESEVSSHFSDIESAFSLYLNVEHIAEMFQLDYFSDTLTQEQIEVYNNIIGGKTEKDGTKIQGINEFVNLYNQQHKEAKLPLLKPLYKMILSDRIALSWLPDEFDNDKDMLTAINEYYDSVHHVISGNDEARIDNLLKNIVEYDTSHIYISNDKGLTDISQQMFGQYDVFTNAIKDELRRNIKPTPKEKRNPELLEERINSLFKKEKSFSISYLNSLIKDKDSGTIESYYAKLGARDKDGVQTVNLLTQIEMAYSVAKEVLDGKYANINQSEKATKSIKDFLDAFKSLQHFIKPLLGSGEEADKDNSFCAQLINVWESLDVITPLYNKVRNWLTRKPYSTKKIKLNFENAQLLGGWDMNKETDYTSVLLRKGNFFYLAIMDKRYNHAFDFDKLPCDGDCFEKIDYKLLPGANKMLPKVFFSKSRIDEFAPSPAIISAYQKETHKKGKNFSLVECHRLIDFFKQSISKHEDWSKFSFNFSDTSTYEDISGFYREVEQQGYSIGFRNISVNYINQLVEEGKLYLFQIWNKDFSELSKGTPNMHTLYWRMLFERINLLDVVYKLNGQAEIFQ